MVTTVRGKTFEFIVLSGLLGFGLLATVRARQTPSEEKAARGAAAAGKRLFERHCALCHGMDGKGGRGPGLNRVHLAHAPDDEALKSVIAEGFPPSMPEGWFLDEDDVANLAAFVRSLSKIPRDPLPGDPVRGAGVYAKSGCGGCHVLEGRGEGYGPELTGIGDRRSASFLKQAISKPSSVLPEDFLFVKATTASGETMEGIRANEDSFTIQVKDAAGHFHNLRKQELKELKKLRGETPMPPFDGILSVKEMEDLVAYLASQRGKQ
ncbi:MAG TPA: c-type cytochrome [Candidatus Acidoferrum sp.]|nr:c-type cytochrome [Candidatus Acidoferrum sp.]